MTSIYDQGIMPPPKRNKICDPVPGDTGTKANVSREKLNEFQMIVQHGITEARLMQKIEQLAKSRDTTASELDEKMADLNQCTETSLASEMERLEKAIQNFDMVDTAWSAALSRTDVSFMDADDEKMAFLLKGFCSRKLARDEDVDAQKTKKMDSALDEIMRERDSFREELEKMEGKCKDQAAELKAKQKTITMLTEQCLLQKQTGAAANIANDIIEKLRQDLAVQKDQAEELKSRERKAYQIEIARIEKKLEDSMTVNRHLEQSMREVQECLTDAESKNAALKNDNKKYLDANGEMRTTQTAQIEERNVDEQSKNLTEMIAAHEDTLGRREALIKSLQSENEQLVKDKKAYKVTTDYLEDQLLSMEATFVGEIKDILGTSEDALFETLKRLSVPCSMIDVVEIRTESDLCYRACLIKGQRLVKLENAKHILCRIVEVLLYIEQGTDDSCWIKILGSIWASLEASDGFTTKDQINLIASLMHMTKVIIVKLSTRRLSDMALWITCQIHCRVMQWPFSHFVDQDLLDFCVKAFDLKDRLLISTGIAQIMASSAHNQGPSENGSGSEILQRIARRLPDQAKLLTCLYQGENVKVCVYPLAQDMFIFLTWGNGQFVVWNNLTAKCRFFCWEWGFWIRLEEGIADSACCLRVIRHGQGLGAWLISHSITVTHGNPEGVNL